MTLASKRRWLIVLGWAVGVLATVVALLLLLRLVFFEGTHQGPLELSRGVVDIHCHTAGVGAGESGCFVSSAMRASYKFRIYLESFGVNLDALEREGDGLVIQKIAERVQASQQVQAAIVLAMDGVILGDGRLDLERTEFYVPNDFVRAQTLERPELFWGASINPNRTNAIERLEWAHAHGAKLVKWLPSIQLFDPSDVAYVPFYKRMAELKLPLLSHAGHERSFTSARDEFADPWKLKLALENGVTVIVAHIASTGHHENQRATDRLLEMMERYPNLYSEISSLTQVNKLGYLFEALRDDRFAGRLLYGSDYPLINTALVSPWFFPLALEVGQMKRIAEIDNPWDRDVALKAALGVPREIFARATNLLMTQGDLELTP